MSRNIRLRYRDDYRTNQVMILEWRLHEKGIELLVGGPGFEIGGFSIGIYARRQIQNVLDTFTNQHSIPKYDWVEHPRLYTAIYTFTKPVKFASYQGHKTRLAIHAEEWTEYDSIARTVTVHEQGERSWWRWLGRYRFWDACEFLRHGIAIGEER